MSGEDTPTDLETTSSAGPHWLPPDSYDRVIVSCTARRHGAGPRRLPDRQDSRGAIAAVLVDEQHHAAEVLRRLDRVGRVLYVDVERKQEVDLFAVAEEVVTLATLAHTKPNDATVRSLDVVVTRELGPDLRSVRAGVYGTGNIAFKSALLLAERNARVFVAGRSESSVARTVDAINAILPRYQAAPVSAWGPSDTVGLMVTAVSAEGVVDAGWLGRLDRGARVIDVGIDNLDPRFVAGAMDAGIRVTRLDTRAAEGQLPIAAPRFFEEAYGLTAFGGVPVVSGGIVAERGVVVVDNLARPTIVVGVANGIGGLVPDDELRGGERERVADVERRLSLG